MEYLKTGWKRAAEAAIFYCAKNGRFLIAFAIYIPCFFSILVGKFHRGKREGCARYDAGTV
jgi:hypothetical protein